MRLTASGAMKQREDSMKLTAFGKMWKVGDQGTVFYPVTQNEETGKLDLLVAAIWGHQVDMNQLGIKVTFIPTHSVINERGEPLTPDITFQFSRIAKLFLEGEKEQRKAVVSAKDGWDKMPRSAYIQAIETIEHEYDTKNNMKAKRPAIGMLSLLITTECLYVPVENDVPQPDKARLVTQSLSNDRITKLLTLINSNVYAPNLDKGENWLEVTYTFTSARQDKGEAGRAEPIGTAPEYRMSSRFPEAFDALRGRLLGLPKDSSTIEHRNYSYREVPESQIKQALSSFCVIHSDNLSYLTQEGEDILVRNADIVNDMRIKIDKEELKERIDKALDDKKGKVVDIGTEYSFTSEPPTVEQLMKDVHLVPDTDLTKMDEFEGVEL
ncbi:MAG: hypothetical protein LBS29_04785 [Endomicrobium sp.]|jgi:hypothetical protein|nr:hypothetical protein [Endomicrobium sp.]